MSSKFPIGVATMYRQPVLFIAFMGFKSRIAVFTVLLILSTTGCQSQSGPEDYRAQTPVDKITAIIKRGGHSGTQRGVELYFEAARRLYKNGDLASAASITNNLVTTIQINFLAPNERFELSILDAQIQLGLRKYEVATSRVLRIETQNNAQLDRITRLYAAIEAARGNYTAASAAMILWSPKTIGPDLLPPDDGHIERWVSAIWQYARQAASYRVAEMAAQATNEEERAWWQLIRSYNDALTPSEQYTEWTRWRAQNPNHVAAKYGPPFLIQTSPVPTHIALLLPLTGRLAVAGEAIRDGFLSAYFSSNPNSIQSIKVYDTAATPIGTAYKQAIDYGAKLIIGPLAKDQVTEIIALKPSVPILALNTIAKSAANIAGALQVSRKYELIQFALAIEDETRAITRRVGQDGLKRIVLFHNNQDWSVRAAISLNEMLSKTAETTTEIVRTGIFKDIKEVTTIVGEALLIGASSERHHQIDRLFDENVEFTPRRRKDIDGVIALADGMQLATLKPALRFHFGGDLPIYASSQAVRDTDDLTDLDHIRVCDIPWRLYSSPLKTDLHQSYPNSHGNFDSLFAFGIDAFRITNHLPRMIGSPQNRVMGSTGILTLDENGIIRRELAWAIVRSGQIKLIPSVIRTIQPSTPSEM